MGIYRDVYGYILGLNPDGLRWKLALCFCDFADPEPGDCNILWNRVGKRGCLFWNRDLRNLLQTVIGVEVNFIQRLCFFIFWWRKDLHKTFWGATKKCENKNLTQFFLFVPDLSRHFPSNSYRNVHKILKLCAQNGLTCVNIYGLIFEPRFNLIWILATSLNIWQGND